LLIVVTLMVGGFALVDRTRPARSREIGVKPVLTSIPIPLADAAALKGNRNAKVALVLFSDFECPVCARAAREIMPQLETQYINTGKVLLVWRHYPLVIHPSARGAAEAAECAGHQGKFWELHDWAFSHQQDLKSDRLHEVAERLGLDMPTFDKCTGDDAPERVGRDIELAQKLNVSATPSWFIGTVQSDGTVKPIDRITGLGPADMYNKAIDRIVQSR